MLVVVAVILPEPEVAVVRYESDVIREVLNAR